MTSSLERRVSELEAHYTLDTCECAGRFVVEIDDDQNVRPGQECATHGAWWTSRRHIRVPRVAATSEEWMERCRAMLRRRDAGERSP